MFQIYRFYSKKQKIVTKIYNKLPNFKMSNVNQMIESYNFYNFFTKIILSPKAEVDSWKKNLVKWKRQCKANSGFTTTASWYLIVTLR